MSTSHADLTFMPRIGKIRLLNGDGAPQSSVQLEQQRSAAALRAPDKPVMPASFVAESAVTRCPRRGR